jgi:hypothetical protein
MLSESGAGVAITPRQVALTARAIAEHCGSHCQLDMSIVLRPAPISRATKRTPARCRGPLGREGQGGSSPYGSRVARLYPGATPAARIRSPMLGRPSTCRQTGRREENAGQALLERDPS